MVTDIYKDTLQVVPTQRRTITMCGSVSVCLSVFAAWIAIAESGSGKFNMQQLTLCHKYQMYRNLYGFLLYHFLNSMKFYSKYIFSFLVQ